MDIKEIDHIGFVFGRNRNKAIGNTPHDMVNMVAMIATIMDLLREEWKDYGHSGKLQDEAKPIEEASKLDTPYDTLSILKSELGISDIVEIGGYRMRKDWDGKEIVELMVHNRFASIPSNLDPVDVLYRIRKALDMRRIGFPDLT